RPRHLPHVRCTDARGPVRVLPAPRPRDRHSAPDAAGAWRVTRRFVEGDRVLLVDNKKRRHLITLVAGGQFHTHAGIVEHDSIVGGDAGLTVRTSRGARLIAVRPTLSEYVLEMPRGAQVIYPKDLGPILMLADIFP